MTQILEKISVTLLEILSWFKNPKLIPVTEMELLEETEKSEESLAQDKNAVKKIKTLSDLLDTIELTFNAYKMKDDKLSFIDQSSRIALRKMGAFVPYENSDDETWFDDVGERIFPTSKQLPSLMMLSTNFKCSKEKKPNTGVYPSFIFAIKHEVLPYEVQKIDGTPYKFGMAFEETGLFWICCWVVVKKDLSIEVCKEHRVEKINITPQGRNKGSFSKKVFDTAFFAKTYRENEEEGIVIIKKAFTALINFWNKRQEHWQVSVSKHKHRVTFCINKSLTKNFFSDREKVIKTPTGKAKTIIHYVKEHTRIVNNKSIKIKEHLRGVNAFNWNGYECLVTAPDFHNLYLTNLTVAATGASEDERRSKNTISITKVVKTLSAIQDSQAYRGHA